MAVTPLEASQRAVRPEPHLRSATAFASLHGTVSRRSSNERSRRVVPHPKGSNGSVPTVPELSLPFREVGTVGHIAEAAELRLQGCDAVRVLRRAVRIDTPSVSRMRRSNLRP